MTCHGSNSHNNNDDNHNHNHNHYCCLQRMDGWMVRIYADHHFNITTIIINSSYNPSFNFNLRACVLLFMRTNNIQYVRYGCRTLIVVWEK